MYSITYMGWEIKNNLFHNEIKHKSINVLFNCFDGYRHKSIDNHIISYHMYNVKVNDLTWWWHLLCYRWLLNFQIKYIISWQLINDPGHIIKFNIYPSMQYIKSCNYTALINIVTGIWNTLLECIIWPFN